jgi:hypothetical protein
MAAPATDTRVSLTKGQFLQIYRWQQQLPLPSLSTMSELRIDDLTKLERDEPTKVAEPDLARLAEILGCTAEIWAQIGIAPGFPGTDAPTGSVSQVSFAAQINRIAAMPEAFRARQFQVISRELGYIDA